MKSFWCISVIIAVLFMSVDGAADTVIKGHAHPDGAVHQLDDGNPATPDKSSDSDTDPDHCERCCHGHSAGIGMQVATIRTAFATDDRKHRRSPHVGKVAQAPPTPPPNA